jgi:hypothetical protein
LGTEIQRTKSKQLDHLQYQYLYILLELLTGAKNNCKNWTGNKVTADQPWTESTKGRYTLLAIFPENRYEKVLCSKQKPMQ